MARLKPKLPVKGKRPVAAKWRVTNPFGVKGPYIAGVHTGVDYGVPIGTPVVSPRFGTVIRSDYSPADYGNYVEVKRWDGKKVYLFAHLSSRKVFAGQRVARGQMIGHSGDTGNSTGPHCHIEQRHSPFGYRDFEKPDWA